MVNIVLLRKAIEAQGRRINWVAARLGVSGQHMTNMLAGRRTISRTQAERLAEILDLPVDLMWTPVTFNAEAVPVLV